MGPRGGVTCRVTECLISMLLLGLETKSGNVNIVTPIFEDHQGR